ncbi:MAG: iron ABC transporter permease [Methanomicrobia archaeon]|nr:iron ABC transporter permease [Methanomicrobia archaeon]
MTRNRSVSEKVTTSDEIRTYYKRFIARKLLFMALLIILIGLIAGVATTLGSYQISVTEVYTIIWHGLFHEPETTKELVVWNLRLPSIVMGILAGIGLAIAGTTMQSVVRNPLASPYTLGIASAAGFGAALAIILGRGFAAGQYLIIANAFIFAVLSAFIIYGLSRYRGATPETMILAGIALMYLFSAMTGILQYFGEQTAVAEVVFWMFGSLGRATWDKLLFVFIILAICIPLLMLKSWDLNTLSAGDESAKSLGVNVDQTRVLCFILASIMTAGVICFTGTIGFIGLVAPHMCRLVIGGDNRYLIPASGFLGAVILLAADTVARRILAPTILPVGLLTSFLGVPLFLYLILRRKREYW